MTRPRTPHARRILVPGPQWPGRWPVEYPAIDGVLDDGRNTDGSVPADWYRAAARADRGSDR